MVAAFKGLVMVIKEVTKPEIFKEVLELHGINKFTNNCSSVIAISCVLRRLAGYMCPCSRSQLAKALIDSFKFIVNTNEVFAQKVDEVVEALISHGDLMEICDATTIDPNQKRTWVFAVPPAYVPRKSGNIFLAGITPDQISPLPNELEERIEYIEHLRLIRQLEGENLLEIFKELGMTELSEKAWLKSPPRETPKAFLESMQQKLESLDYCGEIPDLTILDPDKPVNYYRGRWTNGEGKSGHFIARRPQAFGADLWGYTKLDNGMPIFFLDFPLPNNRYRGCDFAWRLQAAIDWCCDHPQTFRVRDSINNDDVGIDFFSPVPLWVRRRLDAIGKPTPSLKCLFSYIVSQSDINLEIKYLEDDIWLTRLA